MLANLIQDSVDHLLDFNPFLRSSLPQINRLAVDVLEEEDRYEIKADLPGVDKDNIDISTNEDVLTISCRRDVCKENKQKGYYIRERRYGELSRSFHLPLMDVANIEASLSNGVLNLRIPKNETKKKSKIQIKD